MFDYLEPLGITQHRVAVAIGVPARINEIVHGKRVERQVPATGNNGSDHVPSARNP